MSPVATTRPIATIPVSGYLLPATTPPFNDIAAALRDDSDGTFVYSAFDDHTAPGAGVVWSVQMAGVVLDAGARIEWAQWRARVACIAPYLEQCGIWYRNTSESIVVANDGAIREWVGNRMARDPATGGEWQASALSGIQPTLQFYDPSGHSPGAISQCNLYELYLDLFQRRQGAVVGVGPDSMTVTQPTIHWTPTAPVTTAAQVKWEMRVFDDATASRPGFNPNDTDTYVPVWDSNQVFSSTQRSATIGKRLRDGETYHVYVWAAQQWSGDDFWSTPGITVFTLDLPPIAGPSLASAVADDDNARAVLRTGAGYVPGPDPTRYELERSADGGSTWALVSDWVEATNDPGTIYDYLAPRGVELLYRVRAITDVNTSDWSDELPLRLAVDGWWLKHPAQPDLNTKIRVLPSKLNRPNPQTASDVLGDDKAVVTGDGHKAWRGSLVIQTESSVEYAALMALLDAETTLFLQDSVGRQWFVVMGDNEEFEMLRSIPAAEEPQFAIRHLHRITVPFTEVRTP